MPFGWGSTWDASGKGLLFVLLNKVTNAFRLGVHLGRKISPYHGESRQRVTNAFRLGVHLGHLIARHSNPGTFVTNAFRLGVHLGLKELEEQGIRFAGSPMPFGWGSTWDNWCVSTKLNSWKSHQCLSAGGPLGTEIKIECNPVINQVTNAFRLGVHLGRGIKDAVFNNLLCRHQCLSAGGPLGTCDMEDRMAEQAEQSPMPFGWGSTWDTGAPAGAQDPNSQSPMPFGWGSTWDPI